MIHYLPRRILLLIKRYAFLSFFGVAILPFLSIWYTEHGSHPQLAAWLAVLVIYIVLPLIDFIIGKDSSNPSADEQLNMQSDSYYRWLALSLLPVSYGVAIFCVVQFATQTHWTVFGYIGWTLSSGICVAILAINAGHELIHKENKLENWAGGLLYALIFFGAFKVEHVRGHHVNVATSGDASSAHIGQSLYKFLPQAFRRNFLSAWQLEAKLLRAKQLPSIHWRNELIWWYSISIFLCLSFWFFLSAKAAVFYLAICAVSITTLEVINYVEHYGLRRRRMPNGHYERPTPAHSWNSNYFLSGVGMFQVQRHSDHHAFPKRRYQLLRHYDDSPQLPLGYASMYLLALIPPLWFRIMNPRVRRYYHGIGWRLSSKQFETKLAHSSA